MKTRTVYLEGKPIPLKRAMAMFSENEYTVTFQGDEIRPAKRSKPDLRGYKPDLKPLKRDKKQRGHVPLSYPDGNIYRIKPERKPTGDILPIVRLPGWYPTRLGGNINKVVYTNKNQIGIPIGMEGGGTINGR